MVSVTTNSVPILNTQTASYTPKFPQMCTTCSTSFIKCISDVTCVDFGKLGIPQCFSLWPATAAAMAESTCFKVRTCVLQKFTLAVLALPRFHHKLILKSFFAFFFLCSEPWNYRSFSQTLAWKQKPSRPKLGPLFRVLSCTSAWYRCVTRPVWRVSF